LNIVLNTFQTKTAKTQIFSFILYEKESVKVEFQPGVKTEREMKIQQMKQEVKINEVTLFTCSNAFLILISKRSTG